MIVTAAVTRGADDPFTLQPVELAEPRPDELVVRVSAVGVCHTDLVTRSGLRGHPGVLGHEGAGVVEHVGPGVSGVGVGDHVVLTFRSCGTCRACSTGHPAYCIATRRLNSSGGRPDGTPTLRQDGAALFGAFFGQSSFATHALVGADNAVVVPHDTDLAVAAPLGCGFQTGAGAVLNVLRPGPDDALVVHGAGSVGLAAVLAARASGVGQVVVVDPVPSRRGLATELGAVAVAPGDDGAASIRELTGGASHALDTTGRPDVVAAGVAALRPRGTMAVVGLGAPEMTFDLRDLMLGGKSIVGCIEGDTEPHEFIPAMLRLQREGRLPLERLVTRYPFDDIERAVADQLAGAVVKPVLVMSH